jgi:hypothetical protein
LIGLVMKSVAPASNASVTAITSSSAVSISTGVWPLRSERRIVRQASKPFITGIRTSIRIRSGVSASASRVALWPSCASSTR